MIVQEGKASPEMAASQRRLAAVHAVKERHGGKRISQMSQAERAELLEALAIAAGFADENGVVR